MLRHRALIHEPGIRWQNNRGSDTSVRMDSSLRRIVLIVALVNLAYFRVEFAVALTFGSVALFADSIDFLDDASVNLLILLALGWRALARG